VNLTAILSDALLRTRSDAIIAADQGGVIRFWNPGAERLFGYCAAEAVERSLDLIIPGRLRQRHWDGYRRVMASGESRYGAADVLAVPAVRKDGVTISVEFTVVPLAREGRTVGLVAIMRDVTERFEELRRLKRELADKTKRGS